MCWYAILSLCWQEIIGEPFVNSIISLGHLILIQTNKLNLSDTLDIFQANVFLIFHQTFINKGFPENI